MAARHRRVAPPYPPCPPSRRHARRRCHPAAHTLPPPSNRQRRRPAPLPVRLSARAWPANLRSRRHPQRASLHRPLAQCPPPPRRRRSPLPPPASLPPPCPRNARPPRRRASPTVPRPTRVSPALAIALAAHAPARPARRAAVPFSASLPRHL